MISEQTESVELSDVFRAATLIQCGLQPRLRPLQNAEYRELIREYMNRSDFRKVVAEMSEGLGLYVLNVSEHGIVLSPREGSVFWMKPSELRPGNPSADKRLLDGIIQITIAATVFPRARDLEDDVNRPRPPVTVEEIDDTLRAICASLKKEFANVDPNADDIRMGIYDAWRVYDNTLSARETRDGRDAAMTTTRMIKYNLEKLKEYGCFTETRYGGKEAWQATRRYNVLVQDVAASRIYDEIMRINAKHSKSGTNSGYSRDLRDWNGESSNEEEIQENGGEINSIHESSMIFNEDLVNMDVSDFDSDASENAEWGEALETSADSGDMDARESARRERPRVDEHGIEYAEDYFESGDEDEGTRHFDPFGDALFESADRERWARSQLSDENAVLEGDETPLSLKMDETPRVDEHGIEYADDYFARNPDEAMWKPKSGDEDFGGQGVNVSEFADEDGDFEGGELSETRIESVSDIEDVEVSTTEFGENSESEPLSGKAKGAKRSSLRRRGGKKS